MSGYCPCIMTHARDRSRTEWSRVFLALALVGVVLKIIVPPGFMVGSVDAGGRAGYPLVICTGHGPAMAPSDLGGKSPGQKPRADSPCSFAGQASAASPPILSPIAAPWVRLKTLLVFAHFDLAPGRGLAAPPPPSQGPPVSLL